jgi:ParB family chromosome partitioning protein
MHGKTRTVVTAVPLDRIDANPAQPRRHFDANALAELADSIRKHGVLQPVIVCRGNAGRYLLMAGERRLRAAKLAGLSVLPALIRDDDPIEVAMIENLQREDLSPLEEAEGLGSLIDQYGYTHEVLADLIGKSRPYVSNTLALRRLPDNIKNEYHAAPEVSREILISVARAESPQRQEMLWRLAKLRKLSVQRFRSAQAGESESRSEVEELGRLLRKLGRKLKVLEGAELSGLQREQLARLLSRAEQQIGRALHKHAELTEASSLAAGIDSPR